MFEMQRMCKNLVKRKSLRGTEESKNRGHERAIGERKSTRTGARDILGSCAGVQGRENFGTILVRERHRNEIIFVGVGDTIFMSMR